MNLSSDGDDQRDSFLESIYLEASEDMRVVLGIKEFSRISSRENVCVHESNYSRSKCQELCINLQVAMKAQCTLPWLLLPEDVTLEECNTSSSVRYLISDLRKTDKHERLAEKQQEKLYKLNFTWRKFVPNHDFVPYGYKQLIMPSSVEDECFGIV
ncbi:hypothetical protein JTB14_002362 [Gonioctena quinquepunctata]|nr:hypothetical protein JTB14_002362 [Gonioctena quinquepunctata]